MRLSRIMGLLVLLAGGSAMAQPVAPDVAGIWEWRSTGGRYTGRIMLVQDGGVVRGAYLDNNANIGGELEGSVQGRRLSLRRKVRWGAPGPELEYDLVLDRGGAIRGNVYNVREPRAQYDFVATRVFPAAPAVVVQPPPPPPAPPPPAVRPIDERALAQLIDAIKQATFRQNMLQVLEQAVGYHHFVVDQAARILPLYTFEDDRLTALERLAPRLLDPENGYKLTALFTFSSSKQRAGEILLHR
jgi:hypothetical protein